MTRLAGTPLPLLLVGSEQSRPPAQCDQRFPPPPTLIPLLIAAPSRRSNQHRQSCPACPRVTSWRPCCCCYGLLAVPEVSAADLSSAGPADGQPGASSEDGEEGEDGEASEVRSSCRNQPSVQIQQLQQHRRPPRSSRGKARHSVSSHYRRCIA